MKLTLKNIGKIGNASIDINGITVIAGENDTGKTTVSRALFAVYNSFANVQERIEIERLVSVERALRHMKRGYSAGPFGELTIDREFTGVYKKIAKELLSLLNENAQSKISESEVKEKLSDLLAEYDDKSVGLNDEKVIDAIVPRMTAALKVSDNDIIKTVLRGNLDVEYNGQICSIFSEEAGKIELQTEGAGITVSVQKDSIAFENIGNISFPTEAIYVDDSFVLDAIGIVAYPDFWQRNYGHRERLCRKLYPRRADSPVIENILAKDKIDSIIKKIASVCGGDIVSVRGPVIRYKTGNSDKTLNIRNLSAGLKTFAILKMLLLNGAIDTNGTIILDEPEIHLHPEWQLLFAELIVLIQKEFELHVLLNTHSPYFLRAIQVYAAKHAIADKCKYYMSEAVDAGANITDVTDDIEKIYSKLYRPLQRLENERWQDD